MRLVKESIRGTSGAVVAAKSLLAAALIGLISTSAALAHDAPTVKIKRADQAKARRSAAAPDRFRRRLARRCRPGRARSARRTAPASTRRSPTSSSPATPTRATRSRASGRRARPGRAGPRSEQDVHTDFARTVSPKLASASPTSSGSSRMSSGVRSPESRFRRSGRVSAVYRAEIVVQARRE